MRKLSLTRKGRRRGYTDARIAQVLLYLDRSDKGLNRVAKEFDIPRGTISQWKKRYLDEEEFAERIDKLIDLEEDGHED
ncbi:MAG: helix-turn-helix domain-containing protein [Caldilineaceae bacterium]|nr:helix-turn-helix domain-containing protein [Caldilineaceae bacterium]MDE0077788.1 helix-turn-helix domain-containing protein [Caldilineaceae bacterium]